MDKEKYAIAEGLVAKSRLRKHCQKNEIEFSVKALYIVATLHSHAHVIYYFEGEFNNDEFKKKYFSNCLSEIYRMNIISRRCQVFRIETKNKSID